MTAGPPAESPSTMNSSRSSRVFEVQSFSLSGMPAPSSSVLLRMTSRAFLAAMRACEAAIAFFAILLASVGFSSSQSASFSLVTRVTSDRIDVLPSFAFVCPSNCGSRRRTEMMHGEALADVFAERGSRPSP